MTYLCTEITYKLRMRQHYHIDLVEEYSNVNFYSIHLESEQLTPYVKLLIDTSRFISSRIKDGTIVLVDKEIVGNLNFSRDETE